MKRRELAPYLQFEVERWAAKSYEALQHELKKCAVYASDSGSVRYYTEVALAENNPDYVLVSVAVCSEKALWTYLYPLSTKFVVRRNGGVTAPSASG